jgi:hypothetical protein
MRRDDDWEKVIKEEIDQTILPQFRALGGEIRSAAPQAGGLGPRKDKTHG